MSKKKNKKVDSSFINGFAPLAKRKEIKKKKTNKYNGVNISVKNLMSTKFLKKTDLEDYAEILSSSMDMVCENLKKMYNKGNTPLKKEKVYKLLSKKKFAKALKIALKDYEEVPDVILFLISDIYTSNVTAILSKEKILVTYLRIFKDAKKKLIKKIAKVLDIEKVDALSIALTSTTFQGLKLKAIKFRFRKFLDIVYKFDTRVEEEKMKIIIKKCFGKHVTKFILYALEEKSRDVSKIPCYNPITNVVLELLEKSDKKTRKMILSSYAKDRKGNENIRRRTSIMNLPEENFPNICKTRKKLINLGTKKELFY